MNDSLVPASSEELNSDKWKIWDAELNSYLPIPFQIYLLFLVMLWSWPLVIRTLNYLAKIDVDTLLGISSSGDPTEAATESLRKRYSDDDELDGKSNLLLRTTTTTTERLNSDSASEMFWIAQKSTILLALAFILKATVSNSFFGHPVAIWFLYGTTVAWILNLVPRLVVGRRNIVIRKWFRQSLWRIILPAHNNSNNQKQASSGNSAQTTRFADVLLADVLCSFARVLADIANLTLSSLSVSMRYKIIGQSLCFGLPFMWRLRQCVTDYLITKDTRNLANAVKYSTVIPVILANISLRSDPNSLFLYLMWMIFQFISSAYSLWWDIYMDWNLGFGDLSCCSGFFQIGEVTVRRQSKRKSSATQGLILEKNSLPSPVTSPASFSSSNNNSSPSSSPSRTRRLFSPASVNQKHFLLFPNQPYLYLALILLNSLIRFAWLPQTLHQLIHHHGQVLFLLLGNSNSIDLDPSLDRNLAPLGFFDTRVYLFMMQGIEVLRRVFWLLLRIENQRISIMTSALDE